MTRKYVAPWKATLAIVFIIYGLVTSSRPPKIDLGFILDSSAYMSNATFERAIQLIKNFANHLSISSGTTRVGVYTVSDELNEHFHFKKHVNRECLLKALHNITRKNNSLTASKNNTSEERTSKLLHKAIATLRQKSNEILGQRRIYIFLTTSRKQMLKLKTRSLAAGEKDVYTILIGSNVTKELNKYKIRAKYFVYYDKNDYKEIGRKLKLKEKSYSSCTTNGPTIDECERHCTCVDGKLTDCYRVRDEFTAMTSYERRRYLKAYKTLTSESPYKERYERFIFIHFKYFCFGIHGTEIFLPWHRWYLSLMEDMVKQIDCRVTLPYWDWSVMSHDPWNTTNLWSDRDDGLGGNGHQNKGYCVQDGLFKESSWETPYWEDPLQIMTTTIDQLNADIDDQTAHLAYCLRRGFRGEPPGINSIKNILKIPARRFRDFNLHMIHNYHNRIHNSIGGTMATDYAADSPEFFLHHSFLDKIWYMWQQQSQDQKYVHFLQRNITKMMGCEYTQRDFIDSHDLPRCIKVRYTKLRLANPKNASASKQENPPAAVPERKKPPAPAPKREKRLKDDIDDMARTSNKFWDPILRARWDDTFPDCESTGKDKRRAHELHLSIDTR